MPTAKLIGITAFCLFQAYFLHAQKYYHTKSPYTKNRHNVRATVVGNHKAKTICPIFENSKYPYQGIGFKVGDPFVLTYKLYPTKHYSFAVDIGKPASSLYSRLFREEFDLKSAEFTPGLTNPDYLSHKVRYDYLVEIKSMYHLDVRKLAKGLQLYAGLGWEIRQSKIQYDYLFDTGINQNEFGRYTNKRFTQGAQVIAGVEYSYFQLPLSAFMEIEYYVDLIQQPGWSQSQGGIGLRYVF